jgi:rubrerythrin
MSYGPYNEHDGGTMLRGDETLAESLLFAFGLEKGSYTFYKKAAEKMDDPRSREFFHSMAELELGHMGMVRLIYCGMENEACPASMEEFGEAVPGAYVEGGKLLENALRELDVAFLDEEDARRIAIKHESDAYNFYNKAAKRMENTHARVLFKNLATEEQKHLDELSKLRKTRP